MSRKLRRLISLLLCVSTLFGVLVSPAQAVAAAHASMMAMHHDADSPCGGCDEGTPSACDQHCAALSAGMVVPSAAVTPDVVPQADRVVVMIDAAFESHAGPPGLQPPR